MVRKCTIPMRTNESRTNVDLFSISHYGLDSFCCTWNNHHLFVVCLFQPLRFSFFHLHLRYFYYFQSTTYFSVFFFFFMCNFRRLLLYENSMTECFVPGCEKKCQIFFPSICVCVWVFRLISVELGQRQRACALVEADVSIQYFARYRPAHSAACYWRALRAQITIFVL